MSALIRLCYNYRQMKPIRNYGFTIIETMLFLAVSGVLIAGILVGTGTSINTQRYRDSVVSLRSFLQQQYSEVSNVRNSSMASTDNCAGASYSRGQTNCVILGRYVWVKDSSSTLEVRNVIGIIPLTALTGVPSDVDLLKSYNIKVSPTTTDDSIYNLEWEATMKTKLNTDIEFSMLILRSPASGIIRTFINDSTSIAVGSIRTLVEPLALLKPVTICVDSNGLLNGPKMAVMVNGNITNASGIEMFEKDSGCV